MVRETHQDPTVIKILNDDFIPVRLEGRNHMDLVQKYEVRGAPTTIFFEPDGNEKYRFSGFAGPEDYLKELKKAA